MDEKLLTILSEIRAELRRWRISRYIFRGIIFALLIFLITFSAGNVDKKPEHFVATVKIEGVISSTSYASAEKINGALEKAFKNHGTRAVFLLINSPGGSPVQAGRIYRQIVRLKKDKKIPVYAFIDDIGASGAYYIAAAADKIYADPSAIVGSIGVITQGVGYGELLNKIGLEDRTFTAGEHKSFLNPARPIDDAEKAHLDSLLTELHKQFIDAVKAGRGDKLKENPDLFSGLFWTGTQAQKLGLIDGTDDREVILKKDFVGNKEVDFSAPKDFLEELMHGAATESKAAIKEEMRTKFQFLSK
ncbi:MAG: signal peptide peptidase SppA [Cardiobacteriaceae bacterium]|nr:signal peptide peptidase SppA [Cardiobacteriaceae bacterium]